MGGMANPTGKHRKKRRHHGEGTVIQRRDHWRRSRWAAVVPYRDEAGRRRTMWRSADSAEAAEELRAELVRKLNVAPARSLVLTLHEYAESWLAGQRGHLAPGSWDRYRSHLERRVLPTLGTVPLADLSVTLIREAASRWVGAASTREGTTVVLKAMLREAERDGLLAANPARFLRAPRERRAPTVGLDVEDARHLMATAKGERLHGLLVMTLGLALRRGEALGLRLSDLDLVAGTVRISHSLRRIPPDLRAEGEGPRRLVAPKHGSYRTLPLPDFVADALRDRLAELDAERKAAKVWAPNDLVFCNPDGTPVAFSRLSRWFTALCARAKLPPLRWHDLRGSAATILLAEGVDVRVVQAILGHRRVEQTAEYAKVLPRVSKDAAARMGRALG